MVAVSRPFGAVRGRSAMRGGGGCGTHPFGTSDRTRRTDRTGRRLKRFVWKQVVTPAKLGEAMLADSHYCLGKLGGYVLETS